MPETAPDISAPEVRDENALDLGYTVSVEAFSGPLDLLLFLVRKSELDIIDIPVATIADQFVSLVAEWQRDEVLDLEVAGDFILMAATLLEIKARTIAPPPLDEGERPTEEDDDILDPRADLIGKLLAYRRFKEAVGLLVEREAERALHVTRQLREDIPEDPDEAAGIDLGELQVAELSKHWYTLLARIGGGGPRTVMKDDIPIEGSIRRLAERAEAERELTLHQLFAAEPALQGRISMLMATLECTRQRIVQATQHEQYADAQLRFRPVEERAIVPVVFPPEEGGKKRRRRPPLVTFQAPVAPSSDELEDAPEPEEKHETDEERFLRELNESCDLDGVLSRVHDVEKGFQQYWETLHPPEPKPVAEVPAQPAAIVEAVTVPVEPPVAAAVPEAVVVPSESAAIVVEARRDESPVAPETPVQVADAAAPSNDAAPVAAEPQASVEPAASNAHPEAMQAVPEIDPAVAPPSTDAVASSSDTNPVAVAQEAQAPVEPVGSDVIPETAPVAHESVRVDQPEAEARAPSSIADASEQAASPVIADGDSIAHVVATDAANTADPAPESEAATPATPIPNDAPVAVAEHVSALATPAEVPADSAVVSTEQVADPEASAPLQPETAAAQADEPQAITHQESSEAHAEPVAESPVAQSSSVEPLPEPAVSPVEPEASNEPAIAPTVETDARDDEDAEQSHARREPRDGSPAEFARELAPDVRIEITGEAESSAQPGADDLPQESPVAESISTVISTDVDERIEHPSPLSAESPLPVEPTVAIATAAPVNAPVMASLVRDDAVVDVAIPAMAEPVATPVAESPAVVPVPAMIQVRIETAPALPAAEPIAQPQPTITEVPAVRAAAPAAVVTVPSRWSRTLLLLAAGTAGAALAGWWMLRSEPVPLPIEPAATAVVPPIAAVPVVPPETAPAIVHDPLRAPAPAPESAPQLDGLRRAPSIDLRAVADGPSVQWVDSAQGLPIAVPWYACAPYPEPPASIFAFIAEPRLAGLDPLAFAREGAWAWCAAGAWAVPPASVLPATAFLPDVRPPASLAAWADEPDLRGVPVGVFSQPEGWVICAGRTHEPIALLPPVMLWESAPAAEAAATVPVPEAVAPDSAPAAIP